MNRRFGAPRDESPADRHRRLGLVGVHEDDLPYGARVPDVDFGAKDLQDTGGGRVMAASVLRDYGGGHHAVAYEAYVPVSEMPNPILADVEDARAHRCTDEACGEADEWTGERPCCEYAGWEEGGGYDWEQFSFGSKSFPAPKLHRDASGVLSILDGNHRIEWWTSKTSRSYDYIPCWIVDEMMWGKR